MVDVWGDAVAIAGLVVGIGAGFGAWYNWRQLKLTEAQLLVEQEKVQALGKVVTAVAGVVEGQKLQLEALLAQNQIASNELQVRQQALALQSAKLEWDQKGPLEKAAFHIDRWWQRRRHR